MFVVAAASGSFPRLSKMGLLPHHADETHVLAPRMAALEILGVSPCKPRRMWDWQNLDVVNVPME